MEFLFDHPSSIAVVVLCHVVEVALQAPVGLRQGRGLCAVQCLYVCLRFLAEP